MKKYLNILIALAMCLTLATVVISSNKTADAEAAVDAEDDVIFNIFPPALFMRVDNPDLPFDDIRVRQALSMAIDYNMIKDIYYGGNAEVLAWPVMPMQEFIGAYTPPGELPESARDLYEFNPERAKFLLAEASYPAGFETWVICNPGQVELLKVIKDYFAAIGVVLIIDVKSYSEWMVIGESKTYDQMYMHAVNPRKLFEFSRLLPGKPNNYSMVNDIVINEVYADITSASTRPEKQQLIKEIVPYILEQAYILVPPLPYSISLHGNMTGQKLVGLGNYSRMPPGLEDLASSWFTVTNPDCISEITIQRIFITHGNGNVIYEGPILVGPSGMMLPPPEPVIIKPHETRSIVLNTYVLDATAIPGTYTLEVFWTWTDKEGLPLYGLGETHYYLDGEVVERHYIPMENMEQTLVEKIK